MNTTRVVAIILMGGLLAASPAEANQPGTLQVEINLPASWHPMFDDDIEEAFADRLRDVFRRRGYEGKVAHVTSFDEPDPGCCLLTVHLIDWRVGPTGDIECTFTANLQTERTTRSLGVFSDRVFRWMAGPGRFGLAESFGDAAEGAIRQLYRELAKTNLIPGLDVG